jgi:creatinine amidohydrolase
MRLALAVVGVSMVLAASAAGRQAAGAAGRQAVKPPSGVSLADLSWVDAEPVLTASAVVVIPLGAGALEQGPHLKLNAGERLARYLASRVQAAASVVTAPPLVYHAYPEFVEYPGTAPLTANTAQAMTADVVRGLAKYGPRRFYVLNTEPSALTALSGAAKTLAEAGILLGYTDPGFRLRSTALRLWPRALPSGHADEVATSMMLFVDPSAVDMTKATREYATGTGPLTRQEGGPGRFTRSGVLGDATASTSANGRVLVEMLVAGALEDIEAVRNAPLPAVRRLLHRHRRGRWSNPGPTRESSRTAAPPVRSDPSGKSARGSAPTGDRWTRRNSPRCSRPKGTCAIPMARSSVGRRSS